MFEEFLNHKVFTPDGTYIGRIKKITIDEMGYHIAVIETPFDEMPELRINVISLKKSTKERETIYILKHMPIKLKEIILEKKREEEIRRLEKELLMHTPTSIGTVEVPLKSPKESIFSKIKRLIKTFIEKITRLIFKKTG